MTLIKAGRERRHGEKNEERLALAGQQIELSKSLSDPDHACQRDEARGEGRKRDPQNVALEQCHGTSVSCHIFPGKTMVSSSHGKMALSRTGECASFAARPG